MKVVPLRPILSEHELLESNDCFINTQINFSYEETW